VSHRSHIVRLLTIIGVLVVGFVIVRSLLVPASFGEYGHYRGDNLSEQMAILPVHQGPDMCGQCHEEQYGDWQDGGHLTVTCEVCHGHWEIHNGNLTTMTAVNTSDACLLCHQHITGRPESFSQIAGFVQHLKDQELSEEDADGCVDCHDPHAPL